MPNDENPSNPKRIVVEVVNDPIIKPFLGGFLNKLTGIEYHNAYSQTGPLIDRSKFDKLLTRDTQTELQPTGGIEITSVQPKSECKSKLKQIEDEMATIIQRNFRWHLWKKLIKQSSSEWRSVRITRLCLLQCKNTTLVLNNFCSIISFGTDNVITFDLNEFSNFRQLHSNASSITADDNIVIEMINSPRTQKDFTRLKSKVRIWKEIQVKS